MDGERGVDGPGYPKKLRYVLGTKSLLQRLWTISSLRPLNADLSKSAPSLIPKRPQIWLLSAREAQMCISIRLRQAGLLRQAGRVEDRLFALMVWGRKGLPTNVTETDFVREVEAAFAKSGLGRLGRDSVRGLHKDVGMRRLTELIQAAEERLNEVPPFSPSSFPPGLGDLSPLSNPFLHCRVGYLHCCLPSR